VILSGQAPSGAYPASPTFSQYRAFCWFRDGAFIAEAMSRAGETESAERFFDWCAMIVRAKPSGPWDARYLLSGEEDPVAWWPHRQLDGLGLWIWAMRNHVARHGVAPRWGDAADATAAFLTEHWSEPCHDWWEEREGVHAATMGVHAPGGIVFTAGTTDWAQALAQDWRVARITRNVIERLRKRR